MVSKARVEVGMEWEALAESKPMLAVQHRLYRLAKVRRGPGWERVRASFEAGMADAGALGLFVRMEVLEWAA